MFKIAFIVAMCVAGLTEWLKNLLPAKVKENNVVMASIAAVIAATVGMGATFVLPDIFYRVTILNRIIFAGGVVALTQTSYTLLFQTFKAVKTALTKKMAVDPDSLAEEIANKIVEESEDFFKK
jgi:hypothetical protein